MPRRTRTARRIAAGDNPAVAPLVGAVVGEASVACGNAQTANATVYLVDSVLMPTAE